MRIKKKEIKEDDLIDIANMVMFEIMEKKDLQLEGPEYVSLRNTIYGALQEWYSD